MWVCLENERLRSLSCQDCLSLSWWWCLGRLHQSNWKQRHTILACPVSWEEAREEKTINNGARLGQETALFLQHFKYKTILWVEFYPNFCIIICKSSFLMTALYKSSSFFTSFDDKTLVLLTTVRKTLMLLRCSIVTFIYPSSLNNSLQYLKNREHCNISLFKDKW